MTIATHHANRSATQANVTRSDMRSALALLPGILLAGAIAAAAFLLRSARALPKAASATPPFPWFALGFIALVGLNTVVAIPPDARKVIVTLTTFLLSVALAAMGLETDISRLYAKGLRPAILGSRRVPFHCNVLPDTHQTYAVAIAP